MLLWILGFVSLGVPVGSLVIDRVFGVPARLQWRYWGIPSLVAFIVALFGGLASGNGVASLMLWGIVSGVVATVALDIVRLFGYHVLHAFPVDMPQMFGTIAYGLAPQLQRHVIAQMIRFLSESPEGERRVMLAQRLRAIAGLREPLRLAVVGAMQRGLAQLPEERRQKMMETQIRVLADLPAEQRRTLFEAMDAAMAGKAQPVYAQPRGLPQIPMHLARRFFPVALRQTWQEAGLTPAKAIGAGYLWHFIIGITFAVTYNLLFGHGTWALAYSWGIFVWASMMVAMPFMMPLIKFPWWFPIVPFAAHIVMAIPIGYIALNFIGSTAHAASASGALGWLR